ncbi:MAG: carboxylating nicotinate-nucleotide diphosphorylase [Candidatus Omnitrophica bacterium]|nr:carboxylating nicotinate-nucleotide diphosphorylase [Candidatus Omnitrophota bacterium]
MLSNKILHPLIRQALKEDRAHRDVTTRLTIPARARCTAGIIAKETGIVCGLKAAREAFMLGHEKRLKFSAGVKDGTRCAKGDTIARIRGEARAILVRERVAINFLSLLSGIATMTRSFVDRTRGTRTRIMDTRKTTPALRILEKYAVRTGGGMNHRTALDGAVLIKDNHLRAGKYLVDGRLDEKKFSEMIKRVRRHSDLSVEVEVENMDEFRGVIRCRPDIIMLDNFTVPNLKKAAALRDRHFPRVKLEASGGIRIAQVSRIARTGVDSISVGALTHSPAAFDFSLEIIPE